MTIFSPGERTARVSTSYRPAAIDFGCDYNPEQWSPEVWVEDVALMREIGITVVAINIFGWALLEQSPGAFDFSQLDSVIELLHANGIGVNLGTGTSSPPPWLTTLHPEILPAADDGTTRWPGGRQAWCPSSPVFREYALRLVREVGSRYGSHPAVRLWHVSNELGCHNALCYCDVSAAAFREWLRVRYGSIDAVNAAWGTTFWSQRYTSLSEILPPRLTLSTPNPTQVLDFDRFSSDEVLSYYLAERDELRALTEAPVTTNFMVTAHIKTQDYWRFASEVDVVANDHYVDHRLADPLLELSFSADLTRGLAQGAPWLLMEQATGAVNWQPRNLAKAPGAMMRDSLIHLARGADGISFFQWRASVQGSEKFHSAMLPHAGIHSTTWREVKELGKVLGALSEVTGSRVVADVAIVFSWEAWWACDLDSRPSEEVRYLDQVHRAYRALHESGITVDVIAPGADLSPYSLVVVPALYLVRDEHAAVVENYVAHGGHVVVTYFSGIVDEDDRVRLGGYPGAFRQLLGISTEEFFPLAEGETLVLDDGSTASIWSENTTATSAEVVAAYASGTLHGRAAITRNEYQRGVAWYVGTSLDAVSFADLLQRAAADASVPTSPRVAAAGLEVVTRRSADADFIFLINHAEHPVNYFGGPATELLTGAPVENEIEVPTGAVRVLRLPAPQSSTARQI